MEELTFFTPSYRGDIERFVLLRESIRRFYHGAAHHIVAVPREDVALFKKVLEGDNVEIVKQNNFVASYFYPRKWYPLLKRAIPNQIWRFEAYAGRLGWIIQQIVKLSLPEIVHDRAIAILDSDIVFIRTFDNSDLGVVSDKRILVRDEPTTESGKHRKYMEKARSLLGLSPGSTEHHYMAYPAIWYTDWVKELRKYIESIHEKPWQRVLYEANTISEYQLYGVFIEEILKPFNLRIRLKPFHYGIWDHNDFKRFMLGELVINERDFHNKPLCVVLQSNLKMPVDESRKRIESLWDINENDSVTQKYRNSKESK